MHTPAEFWRTLYLRTGIGLTPKGRAFLTEMGAVDNWCNAADEAQEKLALSSACKQLAALSRSGLLGEEMPLEEWRESTSRHGDRWQLWAELRSALSGSDDWAPFTLTRVIDATAEPALSATRVEISFDARLPRTAVVSMLRRTWPQLIKAGWVRRTRPLSVRNVALMKHVCLESEPGTSWRNLLKEWNRKWPDWTVKDVRGFHAAFGRAEKELTGEAYGLEWFYNLRARRNPLVGLKVRDLDEALKAHSSDEVGRHLRRELRRSSRAVVIQLADTHARLVIWAHGLADQGLSEAEIAEQLPEVLPDVDWTDMHEEGVFEEVVETVQDLLAEDLDKARSSRLGGFRVDEAKKQSG